MPNIPIRDGKRDWLSLDTKWKLPDARLYDPGWKYHLSERDFYQMLASGQPPETTYGDT